MSLACPACGAGLPKRAPIHGRDRLHGVPGEFDVVVCETCGSGRTLPLVPADELHTLYPQDYNAYTLPAQPLARLLATALFEARYRKALRTRPLREVASRPAGRLLDVGSGRGDLGVVLQRRGWEVVGLEPSAEACTEANRRGVRSVEGTLASTGDELGTDFDAVVFNHSLEHVVEPLHDLTRARSLLRDGGIVVVAAPNFGSWQRRRFGTHWFHLDLPRHRSHFTPAGLERLLRRAGLTEPLVGTATSADGLPMSIQYRAFGRRRLDHGAGRYAAVAASLLAVPLTAAADRAAGGGDILHAVAENRGS